MRIVTWNLGYWTPGNYKSVANRQEQWRYLLGLDPDVICVQECRPEDVSSYGGDAKYEIVGSIPAGWTACSAVVARSGLQPAPVPQAGPLFEILSGYVALATVATARGPLLIASVHTPAKTVDSPSLSDGEHRRLARSGSNQAWFNDVAFGALGELPKDAGFVIAGDWNTARLFDTTYPGPVSATEFFTRAADHGWTETLRERYPEEVRTWLKADEGPYELDHIFTDTLTCERLVNVEVLYTLNGSDAAEISDHAPVIAEFEWPGPA